MLGLLCFSAEAVRQHDDGRSWWRAGLNAALHASVMALPIFITIAWRSEAHGGMTRGWFDWDFKWNYAKMVLRDRWEWFDLASAGIVALILLAAVVQPAADLLAQPAVHRLRAAGRVRDSAADGVRLDLCRHAAAALHAGDARCWRSASRATLTCRSPARSPSSALLSISSRLGGNTLSLAIAANDQKAQLQALDHIPMGARVGGSLTSRTAATAGRCRATAIWARW